VEDPRADPEKAWRTEFPNLSVLPAGPPVEDPAGVLHIVFARLLESLRDSFELILVDSPPLLPVSDARITAAWVDGVVLVAAAGKDRPASFQRSIDELNLAGAKLKGIVLNLAPASDVGYEYYRRPAVLPEDAGEQGAARVPPVAPAHDKS
jgi:receptor protein-tyrosine kinase